MNLLAQLGTISPPPTIPIVDPGNESTFVASFIQNGISLFIIIAFVIALFWTIIAGIRFITSGTDEKAVGAAWGQIYWGLIGMVVVLGSFAIMRLVETFFGVDIISGSFLLPQR